MKKNKIRIHFLGASETVTGSKFMIEVAGKSLMIDCGLFQGLKKLRRLNWEYPPVNIRDIDYVLLTHGHLDHCGYLPRLVKGGFKGKIFGTAPTLHIAKIILEDSARIQEEDAIKANHEHYTKHKKAEPLYTVKDAEKTFSYFSPVPLNEWTELSPEIKFRFKYNGHILGATFIEIIAGGKKFVFSGDIGRENDPLLFPPEFPEEADFLFIESTYGSRNHPVDVKEQISRIIDDAIQKRKTVIIPSFAVERTQALMYILARMKKQNQIGNIPVYIDSPMGNRVTEVFQKYPDWHKLSMEKLNEILSGIRYVESITESLKLIASQEPKIIIAGSGMASGGRVLRYMEHYLKDKNAVLALVGFQAEGTRGRALLEGAGEVKIYGKYVPVYATIENIQGLSSHADQSGLIHWMSKLKTEPERIFIIHGESGSADALRVKIEDTFKWESEIPSLFSIVETDEK